MNLQKLSYEKDVYLDQAQIESYLGRPLGDFDLMSIKYNIETESSFTVRIENGGLRVLSDLEASEYNHHQVGLMLRRMHKRHKLQLAVDHSKFNDEEKQAHDRRIEIQGKLLQGIADTLQKEMPHDLQKDVNSMLPKLF